VVVTLLKVGAVGVYWSVYLAVEASDFTISWNLDCARFSGNQREHQPQFGGRELGLGLGQFGA